MGYAISLHIHFLVCNEQQGQEEFLGLTILCSIDTPISYFLEKSLLYPRGLCAGDRMLEAGLGMLELYPKPTTVPGMG